MLLAVLLAGLSQTQGCFWNASLINRGSMKSPDDGTAALRSLSERAHTDGGTPGMPAESEGARMSGDPEGYLELSLRYTPPDEKLRLGIERFRENDFTAASGLISDYLAVNPNGHFSPEAGFVLGISLMSEGKNEEAVAALAAAHAPKYLDDYRDYYLGEALYRSGDRAGALKIFSGMPQNHPDSVLLRRSSLRAADTLYAMGNCREALPAYKDYADGRRLKDQEPMDVVWFNMARCALSLDDEEKAASYAMKVWYRYPASGLAEKAGAMLEGLLARNVESAKPSFKRRYIRASRLAKAGLTDKSIRELDALCGEIPASGENRTLIGKVFLKLGTLHSLVRDNHRARSVFEKIIRDGKFTPETKAKALLELAAVEKRTERNDKAIELYLEYIKKYPGSGDADNAVYTAAWLHYSMEEYDKASSLLERQIKNYPQSDVRDDALWLLAWISFRKGDLSKAHDMLEISTGSSGDPASASRASYFAAKFALRLKDENHARDLFSRTITEFPLTYYAFMAQHKLAEVWGVRPGNGTDLEAVQASNGGNEGGAFVHDGEAVMEKFSACTKNSIAAVRAASLMRLGFFDDASLELSRIKDSSGGDPEGHYIASAMFALAGDYYKSIATLRPYFVENMLRKPGRGNARFWKRMFPLANRNIVRKSAELNNLDPLFILSISREESTFRPRVVSPAGAMGLMQIIPRTGGLIAGRLNIKEFVPEDLFEPATNTLFGGWYLRELLVKFNGQLPLAVAAYNAGPGAVTKWLAVRGGADLDEFVEEIPYRETRNYCKRVLQTYGIYRVLYDGSAELLPLFTRLNREYKNNIDF